MTEPFFSDISLKMLQNILMRFIQNRIFKETNFATKIF